MGDQIINWLTENGFEVTRENYMSLANPFGDEWDDEDEAALPEEIRNQAAPPGLA